MSESKKLNIGTELTDDELMEMTGGSTFLNTYQRPLRPYPYVKYGIFPGVTIKYGIIPVTKYGIMPLYGIKPVEFVE